MVSINNGEVVGEVPPQAMDPWLQMKLEWLESERERQELQMQDILDRLEAFTQETGKVQRKQEQMTRTHEESLEQSEGQVRKCTERLYDLEKKVHENERMNEEAIKAAGLEFSKRHQESDHDRRNLQATMDRVNTNFQNLSADVASHTTSIAALSVNQQKDQVTIQQKIAMMEQTLRTDLGAFGAQMQQLRVDLGGLGSRYEQQTIQSHAENANVLQQFAVQKQQVIALEVAVQALRSTAVTSATQQQTKAEAFESMQTQPPLQSPHNCAAGAASSMSGAPITTGGLQQPQAFAPQLPQHQQHQQQKSPAKQNKQPDGARAFAPQQSPMTAGTPSVAPGGYPQGIGPLVQQQEKKQQPILPGAPEQQPMQQQRATTGASSGPVKAVPGMMVPKSSSLNAPSPVSMTGVGIPGTTGSLQPPPLNRPKQPTQQHQAKYSMPNMQAPRSKSFGTGR